MKKTVLFATTLVLMFLTLVPKVAVAQLPQRGTKFTDFKIEKGNLDGTSVSLSDYVGKGKYVLVDFWASWCGPCKGEIPNLKAVYEKFGGDKFTVLSVAVWDKIDDTKQAIEAEGMSWPQIINAGEIPTKLYNIRGIPFIMLIGPDGKILETNLRGSAIKDAVESHLKND